MPWSLAERNLTNGENAMIISAQLPGIMRCLELKCVRTQGNEYIPPKFITIVFISEVSNPFLFVFIALTGGQKQQIQHRHY
jgi:hypothetical protein